MLSYRRQQCTRHCSSWRNSAHFSCCRRLTETSTSDRDTPTGTTIPAQDVPNPLFSGEYSNVSSTSNHRQPAIYENTGVSEGDGFTSSPPSTNTVLSPPPTAEYEVLTSPTVQYENVDPPRRTPGLRNNTYVSLTGSGNNDNHDYEAVGHDTISTDVVR